MVTRNKELVCAYGVMGGYMQPQGHLQVLTYVYSACPVLILSNIIHYTHSPQAAIDAKRFCIGSHGPNQPGAEKWWNRTIAIEAGIGQAVYDELLAMGHKLELVEGDKQVLFGKGQLIQRRTDKRTGKLIWGAGSDPRGDGQAVAQI
jgi:gamma-glutamyltranspeptidase/glutathione hydrolase